MRERIMVPGQKSVWPCAHSLGSSGGEGAVRIGAEPPPASSLKWRHRANGSLDWTVNISMALV